MSQPQAAKEAIQALFAEQNTHHRVTLGRTSADGRQKWKLYEMWRTDDLSCNLQPGIQVTVLNVTHTKSLELELGAAKEQLQR